MKQDILEIARELETRQITTEEAKTQLLVLFGVVGQSEQLFAWEKWKVEKGNYPEYRTQDQMVKDYLSQ